MLPEGELVEVVVEKPAAGGRMIARHGGAVILVNGAIPGERVRARVTRAEKQIAFADALEVVEGSSDRRAIDADPLCGGCLYAHIAYERQLQLKSQIIDDAFRRLGRIPLAEAVTVHASPERGYRMRARFHVRDGRAGFYRENTHALCDPRQTQQLSTDAVDEVDRAIAVCRAAGVDVRSVELSENIPADQRALYLETSTSARLADAAEATVRETRITGAIAAASDGTAAAAGDPIVTDAIGSLTEGRGTGGVLRRHPQAFFQSNRFLIAPLVGAVLDAVLEDPVVDLYAGVGLFSVCLAAAGRQRITAVEGNPVSAQDLERNAAAFDPHVRVVRASVESFVRRLPPVRTMIVDPPRTGMSKSASQAIAGSKVPRIVYVSCDPPTMARDARRLLDAGYRLASLAGFDLFPNTPHVESVGVFLLERDHRQLERVS